MQALRKLKGLFGSSMELEENVPFSGDGYEGHISAELDGGDIEDAEIVLKRDIEGGEERREHEISGREDCFRIIREYESDDIDFDKNRFEGYVPHPITINQTETLVDKRERGKTIELERIFSDKTGRPINARGGYSAKIVDGVYEVKEVLKGNSWGIYPGGTSTSDVMNKLANEIPVLQDEFEKLESYPDEYK